MSIPDHRVGKCIQKAIKCACAPNLNHQNQITPRSLNLFLCIDKARQNKRVVCTKFFTHCSNFAPEFEKSVKTKSAQFCLEMSVLLPHYISW